MGSNPGLHGDRPARNRLRHDMANENHQTIQCLRNTVIRQHAKRGTERSLLLCILEDVHAEKCVYSNTFMTSTAQQTTVNRKSKATFNMFAQEWPSFKAQIHNSCRCHSITQQYLKRCLTFIYRTYTATPQSVFFLYIQSTNIFNYSFQTLSRHLRLFLHKMSCIS